MAELYLKPARIPVDQPTKPVCLLVSTVFCILFHVPLNHIA